MIKATKVIKDTPDYRLILELCGHDSLIVLKHKYFTLSNPIVLRKGVSIDESVKRSLKHLQALAWRFYRAELDLLGDTQHA